MQKHESKLQTCKNMSDFDNKNMFLCSNRIFHSSTTYPLIVLLISRLFRVFTERIRSNISVIEEWSGWNPLVLNFYILKNDIVRPDKRRWAVLS